jgi:putative Ca2+/H+ antiporter (TMEM165/GDT1 family)
MEAFLVSTGIVALAEMGDKTQLLSLVLAARFRKPWPIVAGILVATLANHALAGALGTWVTTLLGPDVLRWVLGVSFLAMAAWMLIPDQLDEGDDDGKAPRLGIFGTTVLLSSWPKWATRHKSPPSCSQPNTKPGSGSWPGPRSA